MPRLSKTRKELLNTMMKESIFEATRTVLCEHGVDGMTMNQVAEAASLSKSSLYDYFRNKDELLVFVSNRIVGPFLKMIADLVSAKLSAPDKLERILRYALDDSAKYKPVMRLLGQSAHSEKIRQKTRPKILESLTVIFEQGIQEGSFAPHHPAHTARMFIACLRELFELQKSNESDEAAREYVAMLIRMVRHGFSVRVARQSPPDAADPTESEP